MRDAAPALDRVSSGVPGLDPPSFDLTEQNIDILNDFGCRFVDGTGAFQARSFSSRRSHHSSSGRNSSNSSGFVLLYLWSSGSGCS